jgi:hypothetical protein
MMDAVLEAALARLKDEPRGVRRVGIEIAIFAG